MKAIHDYAPYFEYWCADSSFSDFEARVQKWRDEQYEKTGKSGGQYIAFKPFWKEGEVKFHVEETMPIPDMFRICDPLKFCSTRLKNIFTEYGVENTEFLEIPIIREGGKYQDPPVYLINPLTIYEADNMEKILEWDKKYDKYEGWDMRFFYYEEKIGSAKLFRTMMASSFLCCDELADAIEKANLFDVIISDPEFACSPLKSDFDGKVDVFPGGAMAITGPNRIDEIRARHDAYERSWKNYGTRYFKEIFGKIKD